MNKQKKPHHLKIQNDEVVKSSQPSQLLSCCLFLEASQHACEQQTVEASGCSGALFLGIDQKLPPSWQFSLFVFFNISGVQ